jgi:hypothetical protein
MNNEKSLTRERYEKYYRNIRKGTGLVAEALGLIYDNETFDCAILSYDHHDSEFYGWMNLTRMSAFHKVRIRRNLSAWDLPF